MTQATTLASTRKHKPVAMANSYFRAGVLKQKTADGHSRIKHLLMQRVLAIPILGASSPV
jgi:hypothetical protein